MIHIINYGSGNIRAIGNIYDSLKIPYKIVSKPNEFDNVSKIILPGVGAFDETIKTLNKSGFRDKLDSLVIGDKLPVIGICVGMQILAEDSEEGSQNGLGWIKGNVKKFDINKLNDKPKIPHLGWNSIKVVKDNNLFNGIDQNYGFYFIHSYYFQCLNSEDKLTTTFYGDEFTSSVNSANIYGTQFHPEKSHFNGVKLLENFAKI